MTDNQLSPEQFRQIVDDIETEIGRVIVGQQALIRQTLVTLLAGGNALLEGVPGLGKTMLVRAL
ncbi:MAG: AAA family ATPase, partial [Anaerolineales bacterium]|nr:AAA family ATPase [Anaerolineales bacterium]